MSSLKEDSKQLCDDCQKLILEHAKNKINIANRKNIINNLKGFNNQTNNTYQNIIAKEAMIEENKDNLSFLLSRSNLNNLNNLNNVGSTILGFNDNDISNINPIPRTPRRNINNLQSNLFGNNLPQSLFSNSLNNSYQIHRSNIFNP